MKSFILKTFCQHSFSFLNLTSNSKMFGVSSRYADKLTIGDELLVQENNELTPAKVIGVSIMIMQSINFII